MVKLENQLVTVIGGGGFVGRYVVQHLLSLGARVRVAQRNPRKASFLRPLGELGHIQFVRADVADAASVARAVTGSVAVINLAGSFDDMQKIQADGARHVAEAVRDQAIPLLVHQSAIGADVNSPSLYGRTKGEGEAAVRAAVPQAVILRPSIIFGQEDQFVNRFAQMIRNMPIVPVVEPDAKFQPVFVGDVARAVVAALDPAHAGQTFELAGPRVISMRQLLEWIAAETGYRRKFITVPGNLVAALPFAPMSRDQLKMLQQDNVASADAQSLPDLGIIPTALETISPDWLVQYRQSGRFGVKTHA